MSSSSSEEENASGVKSVIPTSILTLLDEKNKSISLLNEQVNNQKLQLSFYLHRVLRGPKIMELSETCCSNEAEENIHVNLAMSRFCKQNGLKTRIMGLYYRMNDIERRISEVVDSQENLVRGVAGQVVEYFRQDHGSAQIREQDECLNVLKERSPQVAALVKILGSSNKLRKQLEAFRTCCDRLVVIEDERNHLVEQVYSTPASERISYGVLLAVRYEKLKLEREVEEIKREQRQLQEQLIVLRQDGEQNPSLNSGDNLHMNFSLNRLLDSVNSDAVSLITVTKDQRDKYMEEVVRLRESNASLFDEITRLRSALQAKEATESALGELEAELKASREECDTLRGALQQHEAITREIRTLKLGLAEMGMLRKQRDHYRAQVHDLEAIRAAYVQLTEHSPSLKTEQIKILNDTIEERNTQIEYLLRMIEKFATLMEAGTEKRDATTSTHQDEAFEFSVSASESMGVTSLIDEYELMRDSSRETLPVVLPSLHDGLGCYRALIPSRSRNAALNHTTRSADETFKRTKDEGSLEKARSLLERRTIRDIYMRN